MPVTEGAAQPSTAQRLPYGCRQLAQHLLQLLRKSGAPVSSLEARSASYDDPAALALDALLRSVAQVAAGPETAASAAAAAAPTSHTLPDGQTITVGGEGVLAGEALVEPGRLGLDLPSLSAALYTTAASGEKETRKVGVAVCAGCW